MGYWHELLKDFASPTATVIAAGAAVFVTWRLGRGQLDIAKQQAAIAERQANLAAARLQHDQYERRYAVYVAALTFVLLDVLVPREPSDEAINAFVRGTADAAFLFDDDSLVAYFDEIKRKAFSLRSFNWRIKHEPLAEEQERLLKEERDKLLAWFEAQRAELLKRFTPFLRVTQK
jgi:hypothetical protein